MADNQYGRLSRLAAEIINTDGETGLGTVTFTAPLKVMKPLYTARHGKRVMQLMMVSVSAGIMAGDEQHISLNLHPDTTAVVTSQSYEKIHRMPDGKARRSTALSIGSGACCYYHPLPVIPFADSAFESDTQIELADQRSRLIYSEIIASGREAYGESYQYRRFENKVAIRRQGELLYYDNTILEPAQMDVRGYCMTEGYSHLGNLIFCNLPFSDTRIKAIRQEQQERGICGGISRLSESLTAVRVLGHRADEIIRYFDTLVMFPQ